MGQLARCAEQVSWALLGNCQQQQEQQRLCQIVVVVLDCWRAWSPSASGWRARAAMPAANTSKCFKLASYLCFAFFPRNLAACLLRAKVCS